jgi:type II secretory pathway pseudopilin PulG
MERIRCCIKRKKTKPPVERGFTLVEVVVGAGLSVLLTGLILAALTSSRQICTSISANQDLQQTANVIMNKIIKGSKEPGGIFRLSEATSYAVQNLGSELDFTGTDGITRKYLLNNAGDSLIYHHPTAAGTTDELIYKAPKGTTLTSGFWIASANITVGINVGLAKTVNGKNVVGSATTMINIRNHAT